MSSNNYLMITTVLAIAALFSLSTAQGKGLNAIIHDYVTSYVKTGDFSGCILISDHDSLIYEGCFGYADQNFNISNASETKFKIGSVSKQFTATAILLMEDGGALHTKDNIEEYFPDFDRAEEITIKQLLHHSSGITDIYNVPDFNKLSCRKVSLEDLVNIVLTEDLEFQPGSQYQYSNGTYALLAYIIAKESGQTYGNCLKKKTFKPLNMLSTGHARGNEVMKNLPQGYAPLGYASVKLTDFLDTELLKGPGSLHSNTQDMFTWIESIKKRTLLSYDSYDKLLKDYGNNYGFGISVYSSFDYAVFGHDGSVNGYKADYLHYKDADISIVILGNVQTGVSDFFRRDFAAIDPVFSQAVMIKSINQRMISVIF